MNASGYQTSSEIPIGVWIWAKPRPDLDIIGFTYVDPQCGLSAKGGPAAQLNWSEQPVLTLRLPMPETPWRVLNDSEVDQFKLPKQPGWIQHFGPQPAKGSVWGEWRKHPKLQALLHPEYPDDLQVLVHDGGPRITKHRPELIWARIVEMKGDVFSGNALNQPHQLQSIKQYGRFNFIVPAGGPHPLLVSGKYLSERPDWNIHACDKCGLTELFDAPSDLIRVVFPNVPAGNIVQSFTVFCGNCGGTQVVTHKTAMMGA